MSIIWAVKANRYLQYDGTNSTDVCAAMNEYSAGNLYAVTSEADGILVIDATYESQPVGTYTINEDDYVGVVTGEVVSSADFAEQYVTA